MFSHSVIEMMRIIDFIPLTYNIKFAFWNFLMIKHPSRKCRTWSWDAEVKSIRWLCHAEFLVGCHWSGHKSGERYVNMTNASLPLWNRLVLRTADKWDFYGSYYSYDYVVSIGATVAIPWVLEKPLLYKEVPQTNIEWCPLYFRHWQTLIRYIISWISIKSKTRNSLFSLWWGF